jgi:hypothetical protein
MNVEVGGSSVNTINCPCTDADRVTLLTKGALSDEARSILHEPVLAGPEPLLLTDIPENVAFELMLEAERLNLQIAEELCKELKALSRA